MKPLFLGLLAACSFGSAFAQMSPTGVWKTIDDDTKKEKSLVRIVETGGVLSGKIEKFLDPASPPNATCTECSDDRKGQPILGMTIIRGVKKNTEKDAQWDGGWILDPVNGKTYRVRFRPTDGGAKLEVRGYIGTPMFGRTQTWLRVE